MGPRHPSTPAQRIACVASLLAHEGTYGVVTERSRHDGVSRQTLYAWREQGRAALAQAFAAAAPRAGTPRLERLILTLLVAGHASERGIQTCLQAMGVNVSLAAISAVVREAGERALTWLATHPPATARVLALDELYGNDRHGGYLSVVDARGGAVWATVGPLPVDAESWTLLLWEAQERGLRWQGTIHDGGAAIGAACTAVDPGGQHGRDVWHVFHTCAQVQGRLDRQVAALQARTATVVRQAARVAAGHRPRGRTAVTDVAAHRATVEQATGTADAVRYLTHELHRLLEVVVLDHRGVLDSATRRQEAETVLALLGEVREGALPAQRAELTRLHRHVTAALPGLLAFAGPLDRVQQDMAVVLGGDGLALVGWAWQRRAILGSTPDALVAGLPPAWRAAARVLLTAWAGAVRASSAVENWHSLLRPHLAVHRTLSPGLLALLAVWHNHRVFPRGRHRGQNPLMLSGLTTEPTDWLTALGYPPDGAVTGTEPATAERRVAAAA